MNNITPKLIRILAIAPTSRGFGFAVLDMGETLADWGVKMIKRTDKNTESLEKAEALIAQYQPGVLVLQDTSAKHSRRYPRIRALSKRIITMAKKNKVKVRLFSREKVMQTFFTDGEGTKHALAEIIAKRFPEELGDRLPPKRRLWMSEDSRMDIFDAVALVMMPRLTNRKQGEDSND